MIIRPGTLSFDVFLWCVWTGLTIFNSSVFEGFVNYGVPLTPLSSVNSRVGPWYGRSG